MATKEQTATTGCSSSSKNVPYYINDADLPDLPQPVRKLFEEYSEIPAAQVQPHVLEVVWHGISPLTRRFLLGHYVSVSKLPALHVISWGIY